MLKQIIHETPEHTFLSSRKMQRGGTEGVASFYRLSSQWHEFPNMCLLYWGSALSPTIENSSPERKEEMEKNCIVQRRKIPELPLIDSS